jgi:hypothetical protein
MRTRALARLVCAGLLALGLASLPGCFVFDELDAGMEKIDRASAKKKTEPEPAPVASAGTDAETEGRRRSLWEGGRSLNPHEKSDAIARCTLGGSVQFMTRDDCLARGGDPG